MSNQKIIDEFNKLINQIKFDIDTSKNKSEKLIHSYRLNSIQKIIKILENYPKKITSSEQLKDIKGIGKNSLQRIDEILKTGKLSEITQQDNSYLQYIEELENVYGIGRSVAIDLFKKHNVKSIEELKKLYDEGKITLPQNIVKGLKYYGLIQENIPRKEIDDINNYIQRIIHKIDNELFFIICGSYRRLKRTSNDIDIVVIHPSVKTRVDMLKKTRVNYLEKIINYLIKEKFIVESLTSESVQTKYMGLCKLNDNPIRRIDIRFFPVESYYSAILYFTGAKDFNRKMRMIANNYGYTLNEYGLYDENNKTIPVSSEKDIFDILGMEYVDPQFRS